MEVWRPVVGNEDSHEVSSHGRIRNRITGRILKPQPGYSPLSAYTVEVNYPGRGDRQRRVLAEMLLEAFVGPRPRDKDVSRYRDNDASNLAIENLYWGSKPDRKKYRLCDVRGCGKPHAARGFCDTHWKRWHTENADRCSIEECNRPVHGNGLCRPHYARTLRAMVQITPSGATCCR